MTGKSKRSKTYEAGRNPILLEEINQAGVHLLIDFWFGKNIEDEKKLREILIEAGKKSKSTPLKTSVYKFTPHGITGIILLAESHIAIHSWPEIGYLGVDIFTCGENARPYEAFKYLKEQFSPKKTEVKEIKRGLIKNY